MTPTHTEGITRVVLAVQSAGGRAMKRDDGLVYDRDGRKRRRLSGPCDVYGVLPPCGLHVEIEVKVGDDPWRGPQRDFAKTMAGLGARVVLVRWHHRPVGDEADVVAGLGGRFLLLDGEGDAAAIVGALT